MAFNFKKTYKFAVVSALYITLFSGGVIAFLTDYFFEFSLQFCLVFAAVMAAFSFFVLQYQKFIYTIEKHACTHTHTHTHTHTYQWRPPRRPSILPRQCEASPQCQNTRCRKYGRDGNAAKSRQSPIDEGVCVCVCMCGCMYK
jgi:hypothetical protein